MQQVKPPAKPIVRILALVLLMVMAACTPGLGTAEDGQDTTTSAPEGSDPQDSAPGETDPNSPSSPPNPDDPNAADPDTGPNFGPADEGLADLGGQLAISTDTGELWVMAPDGFGPELVAGGATGRATQPTWLPNSEVLAYSYFGADRRGIGYFGLDTEDDPFSDVDGNPIYYLQWSPTAEQIAFLHTSPDQRNTQFGLARPSEAGEPLGVGSPFYLAWAFDGSNVAAHVDEQRVDLWNATSRTSTTLFETTTRFIAPTYLTPSTLLAAREGALGLTSVTTGTTISILGRTGGQVRFVPSSDGTFIAYAGGDEDRSLKIVEVATGTEVVVSEQVAISWEWSSDGNRLAWLGSDSAGLFRWHFFDLEAGEEIGTTQPYAPSGFEVANILPFAAQYALSHNRWSPDGAAFAYAGQAADGLSGIWVEVVESEGAATLVAPGNFVTWSQTDPNGGGGRNPV